MRALALLLRKVVEFSRLKINIEVFNGFFGFKIFHNKTQNLSIFLNFLKVNGQFTDDCQIHKISQSFQIIHAQTIPFTSSLVLHKFTINKSPCHFNASFAWIIKQWINFISNIKIVWLTSITRVTYF